MVPEGIPTRKNLAGNAMVRTVIGSGRHTIKKGPWTASEDAVLTDYVKRHGEGNWNAVQRNSGLMRCGKSCRLRWANHLRPNLKKGAFSGEEENLIVQLHAKFGNKWARMASQLPGRTDNEIKNYWNTRLKRRQRAGLPIYPQEIRPDQNLPDFPQTMIPSPASLAALLSPSPPPPPPQPAGGIHKSDFSAPMSVYNVYNSPAAPPQPRNNFPASSSSYLSRHGLALSLSPSSSSPFSPPSSASFTFSSNPGMSQMPYNSLNIGINQYSNNSRPYFQGLPSMQPVLGQNNRRYINPATSSGSNYNTMIQTSSSGGDDVDNQDEALEGFSHSTHRSNTGLLEDLFGESLARAKKSAVQDTVPKIEAEEDDHADENEKFLWDYRLMEDDSPSHRLKRVKVSPEDGGLEDEDLMSSLLDNSPLAVQMPELYDEYGAVSNGEWPESARVEQRQYSDHPVAAADGASSWKNLPEIY